MSRELSISDLDFGLVFGAFALGYSVLMVPSGWQTPLDRVGSSRPPLRSGHALPWRRASSEH
jgi:hypothetical protein